MAKPHTEVEFGWFIPTTGDGKHIGVKPERESTGEYMIEVGKAAEQAGFTFALIPTGGSCIDSWIVGSQIAAHTKILKPLVAFRPGLIAPVLAARMAASLDYVSGGRALVNVVTGGAPADLIATGDSLAHDHDERYERTREFLEIVKEVWSRSKRNNEQFLAANSSYGSAEKLVYKGKHFQLDGGASLPPPVQEPHPPLYFGGSSAAGKRTAAETADVYLMWAEPLDWIREQIEEVETQLAELKREKGIERTLRYGLRAQVLVRPTEEEAWREAWDIISKVDPEAIERSRARFNHTDSTGQKRQNELREQSRNHDFLVAPNLWAGLSTVRGGGAMLLVGTPEQVSDRLLEYVDLGISSFILSGYPHLEEAKITGELLLPLVKSKLAQREGRNPLPYHETA